MSKTNLNPPLYVLDADDRPHRVYTVEQAAKLINRSVAAIRQHIKTGRLQPYCKLNSKVLLFHADDLHYLERNHLHTLPEK